MLERTFSALTNVECRWHAQRNETWISQSSELHEPDPVRVVVRAPGRQFQRRTSLAYATGSNQGQHGCAIQLELEIGQFCIHTTKLLS